MLWLKIPEYWDRNLWLKIPDNVFWFHLFIFVVVLFLIVQVILIFSLGWEPLTLLWYLPGLTPHLNLTGPCAKRVDHIGMENGTSGQGIKKEVDSRPVASLFGVKGKIM